MLNSLEIRNYRNLRHLTVKKLELLNSLVGTNNTKKTSVFEAIAIRAAVCDELSIIKLQIHSGNMYKIEQQKMKIKQMIWSVWFYTLIFSLVFINTGKAQKRTSIYMGKVYQDSLYKKGPQIIPGKLQCEYYDFGGEGISFHDLDSVNSGSGSLNKPNGTYLNEFRINESVDISYTKFKDPPIDNSNYNFIEPQKDQLYVGWTKAGEWMKYTIKVKKSGNYQIGLMFTSNKEGVIAFAVNDELVTKSITIPSTFVAEDTVAWRQWHHWNYLDNIAKIYLKKGVQTITIHTVEVGDMNYDFVNFKRIN